MSNYRHTRTSNSIDSQKDPGPYLARVVAHLDTNYMGGLEVQLIQTSATGDEMDVKEQLIRVRYASPFYGVTPLSSIGGDNQYRNTQQSYGFWAVPPDIGTNVLVMFLEGNRSRGYWFACVPDEGMNFMVPDPRASTELTSDETPDELKGAKLPVSEYNKSIQPDGADPTQFRKPYNKDFTELLEVQGLLFDETRGTTTSSSRREVPSAVYGWSTPGPLDKRKNSPRGPQGYKDRKIQTPSSRLGGSSFVMDDGDDKYIREKHPADGPPFYINKESGEDGGDETIPQNECIRIRTRTGHQILLHNSEDLIYITNSRGTAWIELTSDGKLDIHAQDSISLMTNQDFNLTAMRDINMEAGRNVNINAAARWSDYAETLDGVPSGNVTIESYFNTNVSTGTGGGTFALTTSRNWELNVDGEIKLTATKDIHILSNSSIYQKADRSIHETAQHSIYRKSFSNMYDIIGGTYFTQATGPIQITSQDSIFESAEVDFNITSGANMFVHAIGGTFDLKSQGNLNIESDATANFKASGIKIESTATIDIGASGAIIVKGSTVDINGPAASAADPATPATPAVIGIKGNSPTAPTPSQRVGKLNRVILPYVFPGATQPVPYETIVPRAPQHEPWTQHENLDPQSFKPDQTDIENVGELPSVDRILTPDTFLKGRGRKSSVFVDGSGGIGFGQEGSHDTSPGLFSADEGGGYNAYNLTDPVEQYGEFFYSRISDGLLASIKTKKRGITAQVAAVFQKPFQDFIDELEDTGYEIKVLFGYNRRKIVGARNPLTAPWSIHSLGAAIDINPAENGYFKRSSLPGGNTVTDMPTAKIRELCRKYGIGWGGDWPSISDAMHFSMAAGGEQGSFRLNRALGRVPISPQLTPQFQQNYSLPDDSGQV